VPYTGLYPLQVQSPVASHLGTAKPHNINRYLHSGALYSEAYRQLLSCLLSGVTLSLMDSKGVTERPLPVVTVVVTRCEHATTTRHNITPTTPNDKNTKRLLCINFSMPPSNGSTCSFKPESSRPKKSGFVGPGGDFHLAIRKNPYF